MVLPEIKHADEAEGVESEVIRDWRIDYKDMLDMQYVYYIMREWFIDNGYVSRNDADFPETNLTVRVNPQMGTEMWIQWRFKKEVEPKKIALWRFDIAIDWHFLGLKDVDIVVKGKKVKAQKGQLELFGKSSLMFDAKKAFSRSDLFKSHKEWLFRKWYKKERSKMKIMLAEESERLQDAMKQYLKLTTYQPEEEISFWDQKPGS